MIIEKIDTYRDGGTVSIRTATGHYTIDRRVMTDEDDRNVIENPTKNMLFIEHPSKGIQLNLEESKQIKKFLESAIKEYTGERKEYGLLGINSIKLPKQ